MPLQRLTKKIADNLEPEHGKDTVFWDMDLRGFGLRVKPNGTKSCVIQYRNRSTGRSRRKTIGQYGPLLSLHQARSIARGLLSDAARGADPVAEARKLRRAPTVRELADRYLQEHAIPKKRPGSVKNDRSILTNHILPKLGNLKVHDVRASDVSALHNGLSATPYQANRTLALLSKMFSLAVHWELCPANPVRGIEKFQEEKRTRWLSDAELLRLTAALDAHPNQIAANAVRLQLLTGARIGEVLNATWDEFDLDRGVWTKPSHHTKQKRTEHLPLSGTAVELLKQLKASRSHEVHLVPSTRRDGPMVELKSFWRSILREAEIEDYHIHDNRHTHASHLVSSGLSLPIVGRLLGHTNPATTQRYAHLADDPLRAAAEVIGKKLAKK